MDVCATELLFLCAVVEDPLPFSTFSIKVFFRRLGGEALVSRRCIESFFLFPPLVPSAKTFPQEIKSKISTAKKKNNTGLPTSMTM